MLTEKGNEYILPSRPPGSVEELVDLNERIGEAEITRAQEFLKSVLPNNLRFRRAREPLLTKRSFLMI